MEKSIWDSGNISSEKEFKRSHSLVLHLESQLRGKELDLCVFLCHFAWKSEKSSVYSQRREDLDPILSESNLNAHNDKTLIHLGLHSVKDGRFPTRNSKYIDYTYL
jgi:hypothetical protein